MEIKKDRIFGLDIIRMLAILFVMITHAAKFIPAKYAKYYSALYYDGVGIFFVLSGFLIGHIFIKQMESKGLSLEEMKNFWIKRWTRTLPNYYLILIILFVIQYNTIQYNTIQYNTISYLIFSQNLFSNMQHSFFEWSWSLSVEEWFYLLLPLFAFILKLLRFSLKNIMLIIILGGLFIIHFFRFTYLFSINDFKYEDFEVIRYSVFYRLDGIMFGVLASYIYFYYRGFWDKNRKVMFWMGIIAFILSNFLDKVIGVNNFLYRTIELSITSITILLILPYMNSIKTSNSKLYKPITFLSITSYSLYLINSIVQMGLAKIVEYYDVNEYYNIVPWSAMFVICYTSFWGVSILLSYWFYKYYEIRATNYLRKKFLPK